MVNCEGYNRNRQICPRGIRTTLKKLLLWQLASQLEIWNGHEPRIVTTTPFGSKTIASGYARIPIFNLTYQPYIAVLWQHMCMIQQVECSIFCDHPHPSQYTFTPWFLSLINSSKTADLVKTHYMKTGFPILPMY